MAADRVSACVSCHEEDSGSERANYGDAYVHAAQLTLGLGSRRGAATAPKYEPTPRDEGGSASSIMMRQAAGSGFGLASRKNHEDLVEQIATAHSCVARLLGLGYM